MTIDEYENVALQTAFYPDRGSNMSYPALGLCGEAGEVAEKVKKCMRDHAGYLDKQQRDQLIKELGDVLWYVAAMAYEIDCPMTEIAERNIKKLASRNLRGTLSGDGDNR